jgi:hypothetical protein
MYLVLLLSYDLCFPGALAVLLYWLLLDSGPSGSYIPILKTPVGCFKVDRLTSRVIVMFLLRYRTQLRFLIPTGGTESTHRNHTDSSLPTGSPAH